MIARIVKTDLGKFHLVAMLPNGKIIHEHFSSLLAAIERTKVLSAIPVTFINLSGRESS